ncbi:MAG TPA: translation initiation factor IF-2 [Bacteroidales bacterium]|nr:translation initiation factor IF-2 [Bacteroidales bacterium]HRZ49415.1 translation initiation factor IF-2 [Bacteroidales bacterium]
MSEANTGIRLSKVAKEFNIGTTTIIDFLSKKGYSVESSPNAKLSTEMYTLIQKEYSQEKSAKEESIKVGLEHAKLETISIEDKLPPRQEESSEEITLDDLLKKSAADAKKTSAKKTEKKPVAPKVEVVEKALEPEAVKPDEKPLEVEEEEVVKTEDQPVELVGGLVVHGSIDLDSLNLRTKPPRKSKEQKEEELRKKREEEKQRKAKAKTADKQETPVVAPEVETPVTPAEEIPEPAPVLTTGPEVTPEAPVTKKQPDVDFLETRVEKLTGPTILGKMELPSPVKKIKKIDKKAPVASSDDDTPVEGGKKKRKRIKAGATRLPDVKDTSQPAKKAKLITKKKQEVKTLASEEDIQKQIKETLARLTPTGKSKSSKLRRQKREIIHQNLEIQRQKEEEGQKIIQVTEFVTVKELASLMNVDVNDIISTCMALGMFVSINQRLDAETLTIVADEFGYKVEFVSIEVQEAIEKFEDHPDDLMPRHPIVTVMGHVDHGKTSLLDYIRKTNVIAGEAGGITQHIGAYEVRLENGKKITFLDTPGHEAFTAMRARGAQVTDIAIIVVAADDQVMPQTREAINHAQAAGVPLIFAINKIDKPGANPEKVKEQLAGMNLLVEDWGGKYQSQDISAKQGLNVDELLEKVLLEAELLDLKCNLSRPAEGTVIESSLDKGRGYVAKLLVQNGTLKTGDVVLAGCYHGRVKAMYNERNQRIQKAGPGSPVLLLGLHGAPQAGDIFNVLSDEKEAKAIANKRLQLQREQGIRTQKHITLDEIGRRIAIGDFRELNIIVKGDVDGSVEALSDSLLKLSTAEAQVNVIHKSVGAVSETDVMLASASDAIIVAFQVRPSVSARKLAEQEQIDIRIYSVIYQAIDEIKSALEGMLAPEIEEKITSNVEVRDVFKITKVGSVAGCMVLDGKINKNSKIRVIRDGIVVYTGSLGSLKRFKDDVKEVSAGYECGLNIENFNDIKVGDIVESYEEVEIKRKL